MIKPILYQIREDLSKHKRYKQDLKEQYIKERLEGSLVSYYNELASSLNQLLLNNDIKSIKTILKKL